MATKVENIEEISESLQEYIETIYRINLKDPDTPYVLNRAISQYMNKKPSSVTNMLRKLSEKNLIKWKPRSKNIRLTPAGRKLAQKIIHNHLIMELFLKNILGFSNETLVHKYACELEHHMTEDIFNAFKNLMGKKNMKKLEDFVSKGLDPELIFEEQIIILPTPESILDEFTSILVKILPEEEKLINKEKEKFLLEY